MLLTHCAIAFGNIPALYVNPKMKASKKRRVLRLPMLGHLETLYIYGLICLCVYETGIHSSLGFDKTLPFLPLMLTSVYCSLGVFYFWICYYYYFLNFNLSKVRVSTTNDTSDKKVY